MLHWYMLHLLFFSVARVLHLVFIFIIPSVSMESRSRYIEGSVLLNTVIGLDIQFCGYKLGSTELLCIKEGEVLDFMIHPGGSSA